MARILKGTYARVLETGAVPHLHPMPGLGVPAGLLDEGRHELRLQLRDVEAELDCILSQHHVVVNAR